MNWIPKHIDISFELYNRLGAEGGEYTRKGVQLTPGYFFDLVIACGSNFSSDRPTECCEKCSDFKECLDSWDRLAKHLSDSSEAYAKLLRDEIGAGIGY